MDNIVDLEIEKAVLGILLSGYRPNQLQPNCFTTEQNQNIYNAITKLNSKTDVLTVSNELKKPTSCLVEFVTNSIGAEKFEEYQRILLSLQVRRQKRKEYEERIKAIEKEDVILEDDSIVPIQSIEYTGLSEAYPTGFNWLDSMVEGGFRGGQLILIGGLSGGGKTTWSLQLTQNFSKLGIPSVWFSYEMRVNELQTKLKGMKGYDDLLLYLPKVLTSYTVEWLENKVVEAIRTTGCKAVFIDNLDFLDTDIRTKTNNDKQKAMTASLKRIGNQYNVMIILNVHVHKLEEGKEPRMQNVYGASEIFKFSDLVVFVHRIPEEVGRGEQALELTDTTKLIIGKNRIAGKLGYSLIKMENNLFEEVTPVTSYVNKKLKEINEPIINRRLKM